MKILYIKLTGNVFYLGQNFFQNKFWYLQNLYDSLLSTVTFQMPYLNYTHDDDYWYSNFLSNMGQNNDIFILYSEAFVDNNHRNARRKTQ
jgi:hypothetical protein